MDISATPLTTYSSRALLNYADSVYTRALPSRVLIYTGLQSFSFSDVEVFVPITSSVHINQTNMTDAAQKLELFAWTKSSTWFLCFKYYQHLHLTNCRASIHGFSAAEFHTRCDNAAPVLTVYRYNTFLFGGFTTLQVKELQLINASSFALLILIRKI